MRKLTERQKNILEFLKSYTKTYGYPPTVREIGEHFGFLWSAARQHLQALDKKGFIKLNPTKSRGIEIPELNTASSHLIPVAGRIRAGRPLLAVEDIDMHIVIDSALFPSKDLFSLKVTGDSMIEAGILDGDFVIVRPQKVIENGEIGVVIIGDEATIKRIFINHGKVTLKPENRNMKPESFNHNEIDIIGKVIGVVRKIS